jgi:hypothetical protein
MTSAVHVGKLYEAVISRRLTHLGCTLTSVGGAFDQCVDLGGTWCLPSTPPAPWVGDAVRLQYTCTGALPPGPISLPVVVQCKATRSPVGVSTLRELVHAVASRFPEDTLAILCSTGGFAWRSLRREREWALRDVLLLHTTQSGSLLQVLQLRRMGARENLPISFSSLSLPQRARELA